MKKKPSSVQHVLHASLSVKIRVNDPDVVLRCVENHADWRSMYYPLLTERAVLEHLAFNALTNGCRRVNQLDGWADLPDDAAIMTVERDVSFE